MSISSSTCSKDECYCPANQLCTCATSTPIPPPELASPRRNPWPSTGVSKALLAKPSPVALASQQQKKQDCLKTCSPFEDPVIGLLGLANHGQTSVESTKEIFQELFNKCLGQEDPAVTEIFLSDDDEDQEEVEGDLMNSEIPSASGSNDNGEKLDSMTIYVADLVQLKDTFERQMREEKMHHERELSETKARNERLKEEMRAQKVQHSLKEELMEKLLEDAKTCNRVLREKMESVQAQLEKKEKVLNETLCEAKAIQSSMEQERERLDAEVCRLTEALMTMNNQGEAKSRGKLRVTTSAPGGLACHTPAPNAEEPSRCLKYWIVI